MGARAFRGAVTAWMALIVLRTVGTAGGSGRLAQLFTDLDGLVQRALSPDVPAIPDIRRRGAGTYDADGNFYPAVPDSVGGRGDVGGPNADPNFPLYDPPPIGQGNPQYDNYPRDGQVGVPM